MSFVELELGEHFGATGAPTPGEIKHWSPKSIMIFGIGVLAIAWLWTVALMLALSIPMLIWLRGWLRTRLQFRRLDQEIDLTRATPLAKRLRHALWAVNSARTATGQADSARQAIALLDEIASYPHAAERFVPERRKLRADLERIERAMPVVGKMVAAGRHERLGHERARQESLAEAANLTLQVGLTDEDLRRANAHDEEGPLTLARIQERAIESGWRPAETATRPRGPLTFGRYASMLTAGFPFKRAISGLQAHR